MEEKKNRKVKRKCNVCQQLVDPIIYWESYGACAHCMRKAVKENAKKHI